eukprot:4507137-Prymnesium_polylepis.1
MAYDAPGGGIVRYARPAVRSGTRYVSMRGYGLWPMANGLWCAVRRYRALRALCRCRVWHEVRVDERLIGSRRVLPT